MQAFHPENRLEQTLLAASQGRDSDAFLAALREHELLVPAPPPGPDLGETDETVLGPDAEVALPNIEHQVIRIPKGTHVSYVHGLARRVDKMPGGGEQFRLLDFDESWIVGTEPLP